MIHVTFSTLVFIYLFLFMALVFGLWIAFGWSRRRQEARALVYRVRCRLCAFEFEDPTDTELPRCPRCGNLNERLPFRIL